MNEMLINRREAFLSLGAIALIPLGLSEDKNQAGIKKEKCEGEIGTFDFEKYYSSIVKQAEEKFGRTINWQSVKYENEFKITGHRFYSGLNNIGQRRKYKSLTEFVFEKSYLPKLPPQLQYSCTFGGNWFPLNKPEDLDLERFTIDKLPNLPPFFYFLEWDGHYNVVMKYDESDRKVYRLEGKDWIRIHKLGAA